MAISTIGWSNLTDDTSWYLTSNTAPIIWYERTNDYTSGSQSYDVVWSHPSGYNGCTNTVEKPKPYFECGRDKDGKIYSKLEL